VLYLNGRRRSSWPRPHAASILSPDTLLLHPQQVEALSHGFPTPPAQGRPCSMLPRGPGPAVISLLSWHGLTYSALPRFQLHACSGYVRPGQLVAIMGPSGSGKSTFLELLCGVRDQLSGHVELDGAKLSRPLLQTGAAVFCRQPQFIPEYTVEEMLLHTRRLYVPQESLAEVQSAVDQVLQDLELERVFERRLDSPLSDGEGRQAVISLSLARWDFLTIVLLL
jgi:ABC-type cobalamin/Fe3+-siderophores transport system ATPase subunit